MAAAPAQKQDANYMGAAGRRRSPLFTSAIYAAWPGIRPAFHGDSGSANASNLAISGLLIVENAKKRILAARQILRRTSCLARESGA